MRFNDKKTGRSREIGMSLPQLTWPAHFCQE